MPTSSITKQFTVKDEKAFEKMLRDCEQAPPPTYSGHDPLARGRDLLKQFEPGKERKNDVNVDFLIVAGTHYVGKSSFLGAIRNFVGYTGEVLNESKVLKECGSNRSFAESILRESIHGNVQWQLPMTMETTLSFPWLAEELEKAKEKGYRIKLHYIAVCSKSEITNRIRNLLHRHTTLVPYEEFCDTFDRRWASLARILPLCQEAYLYDNTMGFHEVARLKDGNVVITVENPPEWILEFLGYCKQSDDIRYWND